MPGRTLLAALPLVLAASLAGAQQASQAGVSQAGARVAPAQAADSAARYTQIARVQRRTGGSLLVAGLATVGAAYVQYARAGRMGMTSGQGVVFAAGAGLGAFGISRWNAARANAATAARWGGGGSQDDAFAVRPPLRPGTPGAR